MAASQAAPQAAEVAQAFHEAYERLAPSFGYETRKASAKPWSDVPEPNRSLMIAVAGEVLASLSAPAPADDEAAQVERMARAAFEAEAQREFEIDSAHYIAGNNRSAPVEPDTWDEVGQDTREDYRRTQRAALAALKEGQKA